LKNAVTLLSLLISTTLFGQQIHYFRVNMGPKTEFFTLENTQNIQKLTHIDVGAGAYLGFRFNPSVFAEIGIIKNDYSFKFEVPTPVNDEVLIGHENTVYPVYSSYQLGFLGGYETHLNEDWVAYGKLGFHLFLAKSLDRTGTISSTRYLDNGDPVKVTWYSNDFEAGNLIFRADAGFYRNVSENLALDFFFSGRSSNLIVNSAKMTLESNAANEQNIVLNNQATSLGFNIGVKYKIRNLE